MSFDEIPSELKEYIFTYFTPNDWINTGKVSTEWLQLTLGSTKKIESCHVLILDHLAEFITQQGKANYKWFSLLTLMPRLEQLECIENTEAFWTEISPICHQLKVLNCKPREVELFDCNKLDISFRNLVELLWDGAHQRPVFLFRILEMAPKLETIKLTYVQINAEWKHKIPKSVKHILLNKAFFMDDDLLNNLSEDTSALETFSVERCWLSVGVSTKLCDETSRLKKLELHFKLGDSIPSTTVKNALRNCRDLESVKACDVIISDSWQRLIPENVRSIDLSEMKVEENIRHDFSLDWLFQNYACLQSLELRWVDWTRFDSQKFYSTKNLKKLYLDNFEWPYDRFSDVCVRMIRGSHLVDVEIWKILIDEYWRQIFPPTIKRLKLKNFQLSKEAKLVFSPQFICENPSNIETLILHASYIDLSVMGLNAFTGMNMLLELQLNILLISGECLQSILTHCSALTNLFIRDLIPGALTNIPINLVLPSVLKLNLKKAVDQPALLLQHFPEVRTVDIAIVSPEPDFSVIMNALQVADTVELKIRVLSRSHLHYLVESIDDKYKYFCLSTVKSELYDLYFYWTNSLLDTCRKLDDIIISKGDEKVLWIKNYPSSPLFRRNFPRIPSTIDEMVQKYDKFMSQTFKPDCAKDLESNDMAIAMGRDWNPSINVNWFE